METTAAPSTPSAPASSSSSTPSTAASSSNTVSPATSGAGVNGASSAGSMASSSSNQSQASSNPETVEVKVNGKIVKMTRQELIDRASMSYAANSKWEEASKIQKRVDQIVNTAKQNPIQALMDPTLGLTKDQIKTAFEQWYLNEFIEPETLTPEQKQLKALQEENRRYKEESEKTFKQQQEAEQSRLTNDATTQIQNQIIEALESSHLPQRNPDVIARMAFYMRQNNKNGWNAPMDLIVRQVDRDIKENISGYTENATGEQLMHLLGEKVVNTLLKHHINKLRSGREARVEPFTADKTTSSMNSRGSITMEDVQRNLRDMRSGKKSF